MMQRDPSSAIAVVTALKGLNGQKVEFSLTADPEASQQGTIAGVEVRNGKLYLTIGDKDGSTRDPGEKKAEHELNAIARLTAPDLASFGLPPSPDGRLHFGLFASAVQGLAGHKVSFGKDEPGITHTLAATAALGDKVYLLVETTDGKGSTKQSCSVLALDEVNFLKDEKTGNVVVDKKTRGQEHSFSAAFKPDPKGRVQEQEAQKPEPQKASAALQHGRDVREHIQEQGFGR